MNTFKVQWRETYVRSEHYDTRAQALSAAARHSATHDTAVEVIDWQDGDVYTVSVSVVHLPYDQRDALEREERDRLDREAGR